MRVLAVSPGPGYSVHDVHTGWLEALRHLGVQTAAFNLDERIAFYANVTMPHDGQHIPALSNEGAVELAINGLYSTCYQLQPDVLLVTSGFFVPDQMLDLIRARGTRVVLIHTEEPYEHDKDLARAVHADVNIVNDPVHLADFGPDAWYQPHCYRPEIHKPEKVDKKFRSEFCFVGTGYPSRERFFEAVDFGGIDVALAGNWTALEPDSPIRPFLVGDAEECLDNTDTAHYYQGCQVSANLYRREANSVDLEHGWALGPREVELAATGTFFLRDPRPESDEVLGMLPSFTSPAEFSDLLGWYLPRLEIRSDLAAKAREAISDRTFTNAARRLLDHLA